jgi:hypothetical protein
VQLRHSRRVPPAHPSLPGTMSDSVYDSANPYRYRALALEELVMRTMETFGGSRDDLKLYYRQFLTLSDGCFRRPGQMAMYLRGLPPAFRTYVYERLRLAKIDLSPCTSSTVEDVHNLVLLMLSAEVSPCVSPRSPTPGGVSQNPPRPDVPKRVSSSSGSTTTSPPPPRASPPCLVSATVSLFDLELQVSSPDSDASPVTSYYLGSAHSLDSHSTPAVTTSSPPQIPTIHAQPHRSSSATQVRSLSLEAQTSSSARNTPTTSPSDCRRADIPQSDPPTHRRRQTYGLRLAPEDHEALSSFSNPILRPNTTAASARVTLSESYELLPFGPSCSLERFPSDASDSGLSPRPLDSSPPSSIVAPPPSVRSFALATSTLASSRGVEPSNRLVSTPVIPAVSRSVSGSSSSSSSDISNCAVPPHLLATSAVPTRNSPASSSSDWRRARDRKSDEPANLRLRKSPRPTVVGKNLEANVGAFRAALDAITKPSAALEVPQDASPSTSEPFKSLPFKSSTSLDWIPSSVASENSVSSHSISTSHSIESPTPPAEPLSLAPSASLVLDLGDDCLNDFASALPFASLASLGSSLSIPSSLFLVSSPCNDSAFPFASSSSFGSSSVFPPSPILSCVPSASSHSVYFSSSPSLMASSSSSDLSSILDLYASLDSSPSLVSPDYDTPPHLPILSSPAVSSSLASKQASSLVSSLCIDSSNTLDSASPIASSSSLESSPSLPSSSSLVSSSGDDSAFPSSSWSLSSTANPSASSVSVFSPSASFHSAPFDTEDSSGLSSPLVEPAEWPQDLSACVWRVRASLEDPQDGPAPSISSEQPVPRILATRTPSSSSIPERSLGEPVLLTPNESDPPTSTSVREDSPSLSLRVLRGNRYTHPSPASEDFRNDIMPDTPKDASPAADSPTSDKSQFRRRDMRANDSNPSSTAPEGDQSQRPASSVLELFRNEFPRSPNTTIGDSASDLAMPEDPQSGLQSVPSSSTSVESATRLPVPSDPTALCSEGGTRPDLSIGDSAVLSAISEDPRSGLAPDIVNHSGLVPCSFVKSPEPSTGSPTPEPIRKSPRSLLAESGSPIRIDCQTSAPNTPRLATRNDRSPSAFETAWSSQSPTPLLSAISLVATVGFFIFAAVWPVFANLFPAFARLHHDLLRPSLLVLSSNSADFLAVSENSCDPLMSGPSNVRRSFPRLAGESRERIPAPPDLATRPEVAPIRFADSSVLVPASEPRLSDHRVQVARRVTEIADTTSESANQHGKELDKPVFVATNPSTSPRTSRYRSRSLPCASSLTRLNSLGLETTSLSATSSVSSVVARLCNLLPTVSLTSNPGRSCSAITEDFQGKLALDASDSGGSVLRQFVESPEQEVPSLVIATHPPKYPRTDRRDSRSLPKTRSPTRLHSLVFEETSFPATPPVPPVLTRLRDQFPALPLISNLGSSYSPILGNLRSELAPGVSDPRRLSPCSSVASPERQTTSPGMATTREPARPSPVHPRLVVRSYRQKSIADTSPLEARGRYPVVCEISSYPPSPTDLRHRRTLLAVVALFAFAAVLLLFAIVPRVFADDPSLSANVLADIFPSAQYSATTSSSADVLSIGTSLDTCCDRRSLGGPLLGDVPRDNIDLGAFGPRFRTHLVRVDLEDWRTIRLRKSRPSDVGETTQQTLCDRSKVPRSLSVAFSDCASHRWRLYQHFDCLFTSLHGFWSFSANFPPFECSAFNQGWLISKVPRRCPDSTLGCLRITYYPSIHSLSLPLARRSDLRKVAESATFLGDVLGDFSNTSSPVVRNHDDLIYPGSHRLGDVFGVFPEAWR